MSKKQKNLRQQRFGKQSLQPGKDLQNEKIFRSERKNKNPGRIHRHINHRVIDQRFWTL